MLDKSDKPKKNLIFAILIVVLLVFVSFFYFLTIVFENQNSNGCKYCLDSGNCQTDFSESKLGEFIKIPGGYFILPKDSDIKRTGYDLDSVYVNPFQIGVEKVSIAGYKGVFCLNAENADVRSLDNHVNHLKKEDVGFFLFRVNQLSKFHYRIPNDVEWMYALVYLQSIISKTPRTTPLALQEIQEIQKIQKLPKDSNIQKPTEKQQTP